MSRFVKDGLLDVLLRLWRHLRRRRRRQFVLLLFLMMVAAFADVVTLGAVLPFIGILTSPEVVWGNSLVQTFADVFNINSPEGLILPFTLVFAGAAIFAGFARMLLLWTETRLAYSTAADLGIEAYRRTLYQPYPTHVARNTGEVIAGVFKVNLVVGGALVPVPRFISSVVLVGSITTALIVVDPIVALIGLFGSAGAYAAISWMSRSRLRRNSERIAHEQTQLVKALQEGLGGIRDVLLNGTQQVFSDMYGRADAPMRRAQGDNVFIGLSPRFLLESLAMVLIAGLAYLMSLREGGVAVALPVLAALALGAQRLLPAMQQVYDSWAGLVGNRAAVLDVVELLEQPIPDSSLGPAPAPLEFADGIRMEGVRFRYSDDSPWVLDGIDLAIPKGSRVGFVGSTGSGKSTTLDLVMGLLDPTEGRVVVDGEPVSGDRLRAWQRTIAHVPQFIFLADTNWTENIAFGVDAEGIDEDRVREAARRAQIADFIESDPKGYGARIGERGVKLSGGQRQRIGIARALYKQASVLVLDEATSALDNLTEQSVMDSIDALDRDLTIRREPNRGAGNLRRAIRAKSEFQTNGTSHPIGWRHPGPHPRR
jgi:ATP-binding cassette subfamily B protein